MALDPSSFHKQNITDTCAVWNVLSSGLLFSAAKATGVSFYCSQFVLYECLVKPRKTYTYCEQELKKRLKAAQKDSYFQSYSLEIDDLQMVGILGSRKRLGMGELSSLALALKFNQAFLTDDQKARKLAEEVISARYDDYISHPGHQTTPHLFGWLVFTSSIVDSDKDTVIKQHKEMNRPLEKYFLEMFEEAQRCRCMTNYPKAE